MIYPPRIRQIRGSGKNSAKASAGFQPVPRRRAAAHERRNRPGRAAGPAAQAARSGRPGSFGAEHARYSCHLAEAKVRARHQPRRSRTPPPCDKANYLAALTREAASQPALAYRVLRCPAPLTGPLTPRHRPSQAGAPLAAADLALRFPPRRLRTGRFVPVAAPLGLPHRMRGRNTLTLRHRQRSGPSSRPQKSPPAEAHGGRPSGSPEWSYGPQGG
jgi:hypothetical protein